MYCIKEYYSKIVTRCVDSFVQIREPLPSLLLKNDISKVLFLYPVVFIRLYFCEYKLASIHENSEIPSFYHSPFQYPSVS